MTHAAKEGYADGDASMQENTTIYERRREKKKLRVAVTLTPVFEWILAPIL